MKTLKIASAVCAGLLFSAASMLGSTLYTQPPTNSGNAYSSQNDTTGGNGNFATAFDNFTLSTAGTVTNVQWQGEYFNPPAQGVITGFTINFYAADGGGGAPGTVLDSEHFAGNSGETPDGFPGGFPAFLYSQNIAGFAAAAGTEYWMSIEPDLGFPPQWGWAAGSGGDGVAYQCFFGSCGFNIPEDLAFTLNGGNAPPIPEPSSLLLLGTGLLGAVSAVRRKMSA